MLCTAGLKVLKPLEWEGLGVSINGKHLNDLWLGHDNVVFINDVDDLQQIIQVFGQQSVKAGPMINMQKT